jgi:hypothetical protein
MSAPSLDCKSPPIGPSNASSFSDQQVSLENFLEFIKKNNPNETLESYLRNSSLETFYKDMTQLAISYNRTLVEVVNSLQNQVQGLRPEERRVFDENREFIAIKSNFQTVIQPLFAIIQSQMTQITTLQQDINRLQLEQVQLALRTKALESRLQPQPQPSGISTMLSLVPIVILAGSYVIDYKSLAASSLDTLLNLLGNI